MPRIRSKQSIHQMWQFPQFKCNLLTQYFSLPLSPVHSDPFKKLVTKHESWKGNLFDFFCLPSIVVGCPSVRYHEIAFRSIIPKFKMNISSLLKSRGHSAVCAALVRSGRSANVTEFNLLVRNPSTASVISRNSQWAVTSGTLFCGYNCSLDLGPLLLTWINLNWYQHG